jgi:WD40 repeat protein
VSAEIERPHLDRFGDPLPEEAIARLGAKHFGHDWYTESAVWSPDGKVIASLGGYSSARPLCLWDAASGRELHELAAKAPVLAAAFSPDGKTLAAAEIGRGIVLWDVGSGTERSRFTDPGDPALALDLSAIVSGKQVDRSTDPGGGVAVDFPRTVSPLPLPAGAASSVSGK